MLGRTLGAVLVGVEARLIEVEVDLGGGLPNIAAVGLPDSAVREGIDRIRAALPHAGFKLPQHRIVVNLAPAELRKQGTGLDLPVAVALLAADSQIPPAAAASTVLAGELALDGGLRPVRGALSLAMAAKQAGLPRVIVPSANAGEAALVEGIDVYPASSLADALAALKGQGSPVSSMASPLEDPHPPDGDLAEVVGQAAARRALEIAAAGGHHLLFIGPPGGGKTLLARRLPGILPPLTRDESLEVTRTWSAAGLASGLLTRRPFRAPHHAVSLAALVGGGPRIQPGEMALASGGVLYLDELPEFRRDVLEALRQPLEDRFLTVSRLHARAIFPARFALVASMNPCLCGWLGVGGRCRCTPNEVRRYRGRLSGPLLDRFDLVVEVAPLNPAEILAGGRGESSAAVRERVLAARERQARRLGKPNAEMTLEELDRHVPLATGPKRLLAAAAGRLGLSARGIARVRRVARTVADLAGGVAVEAGHVAEAVQYRQPSEATLGTG